MIIEDKSPNFLFRLSKLFISEHSIDREYIVNSEYVEIGGDYSDLVDEIFSFFKDKGIVTSGNEGERQSCFFYKFLKININKLLETEPNTIEIRIPKLNTFSYDFEVNVRQYKTETWEHRIETYLEKDDEVTNVLNAQIYNGDLSYYDGNLTFDDVYDSETTDETIRNLRRIRQQ